MGERHPGESPGTSRPTSPWGRHLVEDILPWWSRSGADDLRGGVLTCFDNEGGLVSEEKYTWSQGRWAWLCAEIVESSRSGRLDLDRDLWAGRSARTAELLLSGAILPDGTTAFRTTPSGRPIPDEHDGTLATSVFADLFATIGIAAAARISVIDRRELETATTILETAAESIGNRTARTEPYPVPPGFESIAGWMNLMHGSSEVLRALGPGPERSQPLAERIGAVQALSLERLLGTDGLISGAAWWELRPDVSAGMESLLARHRTPGHMLELLWMLVHAERTGAVIPPDAELQDLALEALRIGWDEEHGGIFRYVDRDGGAPRSGDGAAPSSPSRYEELVTSTWSTKLWWVHAEAMYATRLLAHRCGSSELRDWSRRIDDWSMRVFPDREHGEWIQIRNRLGDPLDQVVALPVKDPFHIARALLLLETDGNITAVHHPLKGHR